MSERSRSLARRILRSEAKRGVRRGPGCSSWSLGRDNSLRKRRWSKLGAEGLREGSDEAVGDTWSGSVACTRFNLTSSSSSSSSSSLEASSPCLPLPQGSCFPLLCQGLQAAAQGGGKRRDGRWLGPASGSALLAPAVDALFDPSVSSTEVGTVVLVSPLSVVPTSIFSIGTTSRASSSSSPSSIMSSVLVCCNT